MFKLNNWKEPIYKMDLIGVLVNGFIAAILGGVLTGSIDYLFQIVWSIPLSFSIVILVFFIQWRIKKGFFKFHILYPVLAVFFFILGCWVNIYTVLSINWIINGQYEIYLIFADSTFWLDLLLFPINGIIKGFKIGSPLYIIMGFLNFAIYCWAFWYIYRVVKGRN